MSPTLSRARPDPRRLDGPDRTLDALVGTILFAVQVMIGLLGLAELYRVGVLLAQQSGADGAAEAGFLVALIGSIGIALITTIGFLTRLVRGRRSWTTPLWGTILISVAQIIGFLVMMSDS